MLKPPALPSTALVGIVAPASPVREQYLETGRAELERLGFRTRLGRSIYARSRYTAGESRRRLEDFLAFWDDREVDAIFCARGGYGTLELLESLDPERLRARPKIVLGSSDATALLCFLGARAGIVSFHGPMVAQQIARGEKAYDPANLVEILSGKNGGARLAGPRLRVLHRGSAEGILWGGCLSLVSALAGTPYLPSFPDGLLFLEDEDVKPYQIDRMLTQLRLAGALEGVRGMIFGEMPGCFQHPEQGYRLEEMLADWTRGLGIPVLFGMPSGHCESPAIVLPFGVRARLDDAGIELLEGAVA